MTDLQKIMKKLVERDGSDLHLKAGRPPLIRKGGELTPFEDEGPLSEQEIEEAIADLLGEDLLQELEEKHDLDTSYHIDDVARFRVNLFHQMGKVGCVMRAIPLEVPTIAEMGLPEKLKDFVLRPQGMVLVTGPTGSGKSTSLACMIQHLNKQRNKHVITIEDPIEYVYTDSHCTITQREVGQDTKSFKEALRRGLRQDPDVILVGEMRDRETIEIAIHAAETGHLVFSTLHTNDAKQTLDRILDMFPAESQNQIQNMLSMTLEGVVSQRLLQTKDGEGRIAAMEIMDASPHIRDLIYDGKISDIDQAIAESQDYYGMQTFNQDLARLVEENKVSEEDALSTSQNPGDLRLQLKGVKKGSNIMDDRDFGDEDSEEDEEFDPDADIDQGFEFESN